MTLTQLSYIVAVDNYKNFAAAAEHCFVTQPTLSMQIQKLEAELGVMIFDRTKQPAVPTDIGRKIIDQARLVLHESSRINDIISVATQDVTGIFKLGIIPTIAPYLLPLFIEKFISKYTKLDLVIDEIQTHQIVEKLKKDELDAAILATPLNEASIIERPVYYEPFVAYVSENHELYNKDKIDSKDLSLKDLWLLKEGHCFRDHVLQICKSYLHPSSNDERTLRFEGGTIDTLKKLVEKNFGMTLLPYLSLAEIEGTEKYKHIRTFNEPVPRREISIVYRRSKLKKHIIDLLDKEIRSIIPIELLNKENSIIVG